MYMIEECTRLAVEYPRLIWPFFGNIQITLSTMDYQPCKSIELRDVEIKVSLILQNLEGNYALKQQALNIDQVVFKFVFDFIPTPHRNKRLLLD